MGHEAVARARTCSHAARIHEDGRAEVSPEKIFLPEFQAIFHITCVWAGSVLATIDHDIQVHHRANGSDGSLPEFRSRIRSIQTGSSFDPWERSTCGTPSAEVLRRESGNTLEIPLAKLGPGLYPSPQGSHSSGGKPMRSGSAEANEQRSSRKLSWPGSGVQISGSSSQAWLTSAPPDSPGPMAPAPPAPPASPLPPSPPAPPLPGNPPLPPVPPVGGAS